jgi:hypothetical protein
MKLEDYNPKSTAEKIERLEKLRDGMETVPQKGFNISTWCKGDPQEMFDRTADESNVTVANCGTAGCVVGWMPVLFPEVYEYELYDGKLSQAVKLKGVFRGTGHLSRENFNAGKAYFGLTEAEASSLFLPEQYANHGDATPCDVVKKLNEMIEHYKAEEAAKYGEQVPQA